MELTKYQLDMFNEIGNVGVGHAATALSTMVGRKVDISLPATKLLPKESMFNDNKSDFLIVNSKIAGGLTGNIIVIFTKEFAFPLIDMINGDPEGTLKELDDMAKSAFKEMVNIIAGPYLDSLSEMMNLRLLPKPPTFSYGKLLSFKDSVMNEIEGIKDILYVKTEMHIENKCVFGDLFIVLTEDSMKKVISILEG